MEEKPKYEDGTEVPPYVEDIETGVLMTGVLIIGIILGYLIGENHARPDKLPRDCASSVHGRAHR
jgi:hypothetical protein